MNRTALKNYAPTARREFIQAMTDRAAHYGITISKVEPLMVRGDSVVIGGRQFPQAVAAKRSSLEERVKRDGFGSTMEAIAYTWFNRFAALRYMELHGYLEHGYRVLSHPEGKSAPEVLEHAEHLDLAGLDLNAVIELKMAGTQENDLYRIILLAQCNALHTSMPFLFEKIDDETELLLPDNLLNSDSLMRKLAGEIDEEDWNEVEIIGWLYQFYISEKKDEVIGKVVASEDIPAATQLFTPNWIVKYLVQNTLGRQWLATYPQSTLRQQMEFYIEPSEQTPEVQEQLKAITPTSLNPEELTLLDPACGSGHILVEAYDLFKAIYQERGYRAKDIPALILQKNLFGMEIDDRAAQLAAFALMMKARADDRRIFDIEAKPKILAFEDSQGLKASDIYFALTSPLKGEKEDALESSAPDGHLFETDDNLFTRAEAAKAVASRTPTTVNISQADIAALLELFENAKTFGSLIQVSPKLAAKLPEIEKRLDDVLKFGDLTHASAHVLKPLLQQVLLLARQYDAVVANPPYMGGSYFSPLLKAFVNESYREGKADLYACFLQRNTHFAASSGFVGMITTPNWMFLTSFQEIRSTVLESHTIDTFIHNGRGVFGSDFGSCSFVLRKNSLPDFRGVFRRLFDKQGSVSGNDDLKKIYFHSVNYSPRMADFLRVPGRPLAYWISDLTRETFATLEPVATQFFSDGVTKTGNNEKYLRFHWEPSAVSVSDREQYRFCTKGGEARKYYGNHYWIVNWKKEARDHYRRDNVARITPEYLWEREGATWSDVTIALPTFRYFPRGFVAETKGPVIFAKGEANTLFGLIGMLNSRFSTYVTSLLNPTVSTKIVDIFRIPYAEQAILSAIPTTKELVEIAKKAWDSHELSWDFQRPPQLNRNGSTVKQSKEAADAECLKRFNRTKELEEENNRLFIDAYGLQSELSPEVPDDQVTLYRPNREEDIKRLISYSIGCMMGRYSLDKPGLIYAHSGNAGFDFSQYATFQADDDGIVPILETDWGIHDDATNRFVEFIGVAWPKEHLEENLKFVTESLNRDSKESSREVIRHYLATGFFAHHLQMYKRRPIYWLFSSGRRKAFQALVYLHRYNEGTLARMRTEYVIPLQGKIAASIDQLESDKTKATSTSQRSAIERNLKALKLQKEELVTFDGLLKNYADMRIKIDLDDGVKVNYAKFRDILAEVRAVTGGAEE